MVSWESKTSRPGSAAGGVLPVVGEGDDLAGLFGLGDVGVGVDHLGGGVVLGEEGQHGAGALGAAGHVVLFQHGLVAVVADGVEVAVEPGLAGGQPERAQRGDQPGQQLAGWTRGGRARSRCPGGWPWAARSARGRTPARRRRRARRRGGRGACGRTWPAAASRSTARRSAPGSTGSRPGRPARAGPARPMAGNSSSSPAWSQGSVGGSAGQPRSAAALTGSSRGGRPAAALVAAGQPGQPLGVEDLPDRLRRHRQALGGQRGGDLGDAVPGRPQFQHPVAQRRRWPCAVPSGPAWSRRTGSACPCAAGWPSGARWRWSSRTGRRPRRRASRRRSRRAAPRTGAAPRRRVR